jgi:hypothetical protein
MGAINATIRQAAPEIEVIREGIRMICPNGNQWRNRTTEVSAEFEFLSPWLSSS